MTLEITEQLRQLLVEAPRIPIGSMVSWRTRDGGDVGVVIGQEADDLFVVAATTPQVALRQKTRLTRDEKVTAAMGKALHFKGVTLDVERVPYRKSDIVGRLAGRNLRYYADLARILGKVHA